MRDDNRIEVVRNRFGISGKRIFWSAIFAGVAVVLGLTILFALLGAGVGAASVNPLQERNPLAGLGAGAVIWMGITGIIAFFAGGWLAGYGSWAASRAESLAHGFVMWAVAAVVGLWMIGGAAGSLVSGAAGLIGQTISGGAQAASQSPELSARIREELQRLGINPESIRQQAQTPQGQANAEQQARQTGQAVAQGVSKAALGGFGMLLVDLIASLLGAWVAAYRRRGEVVAAAERVA
jgi:hypothetical protein